MTRILLHPIFLELLSTNALLDRLARRKLTKDNETTELACPLTSSHSNLIWLSEDDLCNMWKVVLKAKLYKTPNGYRMENLAWRLWFYARMKYKEESRPVTVLTRIDHAHGMESPGCWSPKDLPCCSSDIPEITKGPFDTDVQVSRHSVLNGVRKPIRHIPSKSFVAMHEFSLLNLGSSSSSSSSDDECGEIEVEEDPLDLRLLNPDIARKTEDQQTKRPVAKNKKKKNVDKYLQSQAAELDAASRRHNTTADTVEERLDVIKPSADMQVH